MSFLIRSKTGFSIVEVMWVSFGPRLRQCRSASGVRSGRLQGEGMQLSAHAALKRLIDHLVLLDPRLALERVADDVGGVVVPIPAQILDLNIGIRNAFLDTA